MRLNFLGNESAFGERHTNACFLTETGDLVFIDLSMTNIRWAEKLADGLNAENNIYILVTHMHDDHVSGIPLFCQYCYYTRGFTCRVVVPEALYEDMWNELRIKGVLFDGDTTEQVAKLWQIEYYDFGPKITPIPTHHVPELQSFGYHIELPDADIVYTGDTNCLGDFFPFLTYGSEFYCDCSFQGSNVHLNYEDIKNDLNRIKNFAEVYLMHIDSFYLAKEANTGLDYPGIGIGDLFFEMVDHEMKDYTITHEFDEKFKHCRWVEISFLRCAIGQTDHKSLEKVLSTIENEHDFYTNNPPEEKYFKYLEYAIHVLSGGISPHTVVEKYFG